MKTSIIYHKADLDGKCSAAIALMKYPDAALVPYDYGDEFYATFYSGQKVIMVDCSLNLEQMICLGNYSTLTWIDHHKSAIEAMKGHDFAGKQEIGKAGCELTWEYFFPQKKMPRAVYLLGRYDVWDLDASPDVLPFQFGMRLNKWDPGEGDWPSLFNNDRGIDYIKQRGETVSEYQKQQNERLCGSAFEHELDGLKCICINANGVNSQAFESVWDPKKYHIMLSFFLDESKKWKYSLYTDREDVDVSEIAKKRGGGGHKKAAGFFSDEFIF